MKLKELAGIIRQAILVGDEDTEISGLEMDSRKVKPGNLFICVPGIEGFLADRHQFVQAAIENGAAALVVEHDVDGEIPKLFVKDARVAMTRLAAYYYGNPSREFKVIGLTGTNGKTTTSYILEKILSDAGHMTGLMGNIGVKIGERLLATDINTQEPPGLQRNMRVMKEAGCEYCIMEVTSQGLDMGRVAATRFRTAVFTNLTKDHLDYHKTFESYREAKGLLFSRMGNSFSFQEDERQFAVLNADDQASDYFRYLTTAEVITYGIHNSADLRARDIRVTNKGTEFIVSGPSGDYKIQAPFIGEFNIYNILAAISAAVLEGIPFETIVKSIEQGVTVAGRMEAIDEGQDFLVLVDYAHTPDALENALSAIKEIAGGRIITVFGCGGNRDASKRPVMGRIAEKYSERVILTSDNPRFEDPEIILQGIAEGMVSGGEGYEIEADRAKAIKKAILMAKKDDIVLIAGKGHETYQSINGENVHFDDREVARKSLSCRKISN